MQRSNPRHSHSTWLSSPASTFKRHFMQSYSSKRSRKNVECCPIQSHETEIVKSFLLPENESVIVRRGISFHAVALSICVPCTNNAILIRRLTKRKHHRIVFRLNWIEFVEYLRNFKKCALLRSAKLFRWKVSSGIAEEYRLEWSPIGGFFCVRAVKWKTLSFTLKSFIFNVHKHTQRGDL